MTKKFFKLLSDVDFTIKRSYLTKDNSNVFIQADNHGWLIIYNDYTITFKDDDLCDMVNFEHAYKVATNTVGELRYLGDGILTEFEYNVKEN